MKKLTRVGLLDAALGIAVAAGLIGITHQVNVTEGERPLDGAAYALLAIAGASLAFRRRVPTVVLIVASAAVGLYATRSYPDGPIFVVPLVGVYSVASSRPRRQAVLIVAAAGLTALLSALVFGLPRGGSVLHGLVYIGWVAVALLLAEGSRVRREYLVGLEDRARYLEESREQEAGRRVAEERLRMAREVHDVVAHSLASIALRAGVGVRVGTQDPQQAQEALAAIRRASKDALNELRVTLGLMRGDDAKEQRNPAPALSDLDRLVKEAAANGMEVRVELRGVPRPLPSAVEMAAYRIVQESLTNVARHAGSAAAIVTLAYVATGLEVEVVDEGRGVDTEQHAGHGIAGMRERAAAVGGRLEAGPRPQGGFRVWAQLPLGAPG